MQTKIKRIYDTPSKSDGTRVLVDRLWPRGISKDKARISLWMKEVAPSNKLRQWFHVNPDARWKAFQQKYRTELRRNATELKKQFMKLKKPVTLVTSVKDFQKSHISILRKFLN